MIKLPRYMRGKKLASGKTAYFWEAPTWARPQKSGDGSTVPAMRHGAPCPVESQPLGSDLPKALEKADAINGIFDSWMRGEKRELTQGTVQWLFAWYRQQERFTSKAAKTRRDYHAIMDRICEEPMKTGTFGQRYVKSIDAEVADKLYGRFKNKGIRMGAYAMQVCRLVWTWALRHHKTTGVTENPFRRMSIESGAVDGNRPTSRTEYNLYRETARKMGFQSMATAAALTFELCPRVWDVFGFVDGDGDKRRGLVWGDYQPGESFTIRQSKKHGKKVVIPLYEVVDRKKIYLYPELEEELKCTPRSGVLIVVEERTGLPYPLRHMSTVHRKICEEAGLPKKMTFTGFRHGGITELGDAGAEDVRPITGHSEAKTAEIYNKANERKARIIAAKRREHIALIEELESAVG
jgi:hypothetical protein